MTDRDSQLTSSVLMIRPTCFYGNPLTATSNRFQVKTNASIADQLNKALEEFELFTIALKKCGVEVIEFNDTQEPPKPDAIFPNNWVSFHADGTVVLYPMEAVNRRAERRHDIIDQLVDEYKFRVSKVVDLSYHEKEGHYLEGTGSLVLDRVNRIAYACISSRTHLDVLDDFSQRMNFTIVAFNAVDQNDIPIYHTNVLMCIGDSFVVICGKAIPNSDERNTVFESLKRTGHEIVELTIDQMNAFAGNMLELTTASTKNIIVMSQRAKNSLTKEQILRLEKKTRILSVPIDSIENVSGGSVRCMMAEIYLPQKKGDHQG